MPDGPLHEGDQQGIHADADEQIGLLLERGTNFAFQYPIITRIGFTKQRLPPSRQGLNRRIARRRALFDPASYLGDERRPFRTVRGLATTHYFEFAGR